MREQNNTKDSAELPRLYNNFQGQTNSNCIHTTSLENFFSSSVLIKRLPCTLRNSLIWRKTPTSEKTSTLILYTKTTTYRTIHGHYSYDLFAWFCSLPSAFLFRDLHMRSGGTAYNDGSLLLLTSPLRTARTFFSLR